LYDKLSKYEANSGLVIVYGSMYGNTAELADAIAASASQNGVKDIVIHNVSKSHESDIIRDVFKYKGLIIGSPTYNNNLYPAVENILSSLQGRNLKNRFFGYFGGFSWSDATERLLKSFAEEMKFEIVADPVVIKQGMIDDAYEKAINLGIMMAQKLKIS
jgi:anaerobic nitric oxide reductase flavorubredoxin